MTQNYNDIGHKVDTDTKHTDDNWEVRREDAPVDIAIDNKTNKSTDAAMDKLNTGGVLNLLPSIENLPPRWLGCLAQQHKTRERSGRDKIHYSYTVLLQGEKYMYYQALLPPHWPFQDQRIIQMGEPASLCQLGPPYLVWREPVHLGEVLHKAKFHQQNYCCKNTANIDILYCL